MTTTTNLPLPYTFTTLRQYYEPPEPTDGAVAAARAALAVIDPFITAAADELERLEAGEQAAVVALADAAIAGGDIDEAADELGRGSEVPVASYRLDMLHQVRNILTSRLNHAALTDPAYVGWQADCRRLEDEWQRAMNAEDKTTALLDFAERHR